MVRAISSSVLTGFVPQALTSLVAEDETHSDTPDQDEIQQDVEDWSDDVINTFHEHLDAARYIFEAAHEADVSVDYLKTALKLDSRSSLFRHGVPWADARSSYIHALQGGDKGLITLVSHHVKGLFHSVSQPGFQAEWWYRSQSHVTVLDRHEILKSVIKPILLGYTEISGLVYTGKTVRNSCGVCKLALDVDGIIRGLVKELKCYSPKLLFTPPPFHMRFANGVVDLTTYTLLPAQQPADFQVTEYPLTWDEQSSWKKQFSTVDDWFCHNERTWNEALLQSDDFKSLFEVLQSRFPGKTVKAAMFNLGMAASGYIELKYCWLFCPGMPSSGKSVFFKLLGIFFGDYLATPSNEVLKVTFSVCIPSAA